MEERKKIHTWKVIFNQSILKFKEEIKVISNLPLNCDEQRVIHNDVERTRANIITPSERILMENLLIFYCETEGIKYKQGMNEVLAPFLLMTRIGVSSNEAYTFFSLFIQRTLPCMFKDDSFQPVHVHFGIFRLLLRYHNPRITSLFEEHQITPSLYASSWFITIFSSKTLDIDTVLYLWEHLLNEKDEIFICYIAVAFLEYFCDEFIQEDPTLIPQIILSIRLKNPKEVENIVHLAKKIKANMPYSLHARLLKFNISQLDNINSALYNLNSQICLTMQVREFMLRMYPHTKFCGHEHGCECSPQSYNDLPFMAIDCRNKTEQLAGTINNSELLNERAYEDSDFLHSITNEYRGARGQYHICLMGSAPFKIKQEEVKNDKEDDEEDYGQNMMENLLDLFLENDFPYVSIVEGGFQKVHEFAMHYRLPIEKHNPGLCLVCNPESGKNSVIKEGLKKIGNKLVGRFRAFSTAVKGYVRSESSLQFESPDVNKPGSKRKAVTRRPSVENIESN
ncbi:hypothetical protein SteCoe_20712 [Stentor coeruleus]|uniref:Rab-GAP TBC domain-containing protein n=1 Tax=Stentor coeruleus TaxID=5963 RepID=A0A1R2BRI0_9CILI|nr:hypothetical protein SteCoe_20712 [Stentor coeruleus]